MQIIENKALLLNVRNPNKITTVIPKSKDLGEGKVLVHWNLEEWSVKSFAVNSIRPTQIETATVKPMLVKVRI